MRYTRPSITYVFRQTDLKDSKRADIVRFPKDYFYFYHYVRRVFSVQPISVLSHPFLRWLNRLNDQLSRLIWHYDFPVLTLIPFLLKIRQTQIVFATTPKIGLGLSFFKKFNIYSGRIVINIVGLYDQLTILNSRRVNTLVSDLFSEVDQFVSGASWHEALKLADLLKLPINKFQFIPHSGIDTNFFSVEVNTRKDGSILGIGVDPSRDWGLYNRVAQALPHENFVWATDPRLIRQPVPSNVQIKFFSTLELREKIREAKMILILTKQNHHFSGQASAFRTMSCGKTVILTKTPGIEEFPLNHLRNCVLVEPGNVFQIIKYINYLSRNPDQMHQIGKKASQLIQSKYSYERIGDVYVKLFKSII